MQVQLSDQARRQLQCARHLAGWTQADLGQRSKVGFAAIFVLERTGAGEPHELAQVIAALNAVDIQFKDGLPIRVNAVDAALETIPSKDRISISASAGASPPSVGASRSPAL